jgi:hypothetical protein
VFGGQLCEAELPTEAIAETSITDSQSLLISLEITTIPKSSIRRTIPVAFIYTFLLKLQIVLLVFVIKEIYTA